MARLVSGSGTLSGVATQAEINLKANLASPALTGTPTGIVRGSLEADIIDGTKLADDAVDSEHYTDGSIDNAHIADDAINSEHYAAGSIDLEHMSSESVDEDNLHVSNGPTDGYLLTARSSAAGDMTWEAAAGGGGGLTAGDVWMLGATISGSVGIIGAGNWNAATESSPGTGGRLGSAMSQSGGVFTFPSTGYWYVEATCYFRLSSSDAAGRSMDFYMTFSDGSSDFSSACSPIYISNAMSVVDSDTTFSGGHSSSTVLKISATANDLVRFAFSPIDGKGRLRGGSAPDKYTGITFLRLGDI